MFVVAIANGRFGAALVTLILAGKMMLVLLYFNFSRRRSFLGDSGSLFVGFMLAGIGALSAQKSPTVIAVAIPVVSLGLPVLDTLIAVSRRFLRRQPIFAADRGHIHHRLLGRAILRAASYWPSTAYARYSRWPACSWSTTAGTSWRWCS